MIRSRSIVASPPGATIKEQLIDRGMSQKEFASRMDMSEKHISRLINGEVQLTPDVAVRLEMVLGVPSQFWSNLEGIYREKLVKANAENQMDADIELTQKFPYNEMAKNGWVPITRKPKEKAV
ncbi:MAG: HigA family addiction module antitoxin, partial [Eubacteriales bacterium]|nr:HigA family addiction module antitoxin [Eubacteriales bacterium]